MALAAGARRPEPEEHHEDPGEQEDPAGDEQAQRDPAEEVHLHSETEVGGDSGRPVGVHHHDDQVPSLAGQVNETFVPVAFAVQNGWAAGGPSGATAGAGAVALGERAFSSRPSGFDDFVVRDA